MIATAPPVRDDVLKIKNITKHDGHLTVLFDQSVQIKHRDWSTSFANDCHFIAVVTGSYSFSQIFPHSYIPTFSPVCYNLTTTQVQQAAVNKSNQNEIEPAQNAASSLDYYRLNLKIDSEFSENLRNQSSAEFKMLFLNLENFV